jgi:chromosomal replication initiation ATPase DnaA
MRDVAMQQQIESVMVEWARSSGVTLAALLKRARTPVLVAAKFGCAREIHERFHLTLSATAFAMGWRDHTTVLYALAKTAI